MSRSLRVGSEYIPKVKLALKRNGYPSQRKFAEDIVPSLSTVKNFLNGKPVDYENFREICDRLGLDWQSIIHIDVDVEPNEEVAKPHKEIGEAVEPSQSDLSSEQGKLDQSQPGHFGRSKKQISLEASHSIEQLWSKNFGECRGAISRLEIIAKGFPTAYQIIIESLVDFVQTKACSREEELPPDIQVNVRAALLAIGRLNLEEYQLDLSRIDIRGTDLKGVNLEGINLFEANLQRVKLTGANLRGAYLYGAILNGAVLWEANLEGAEFNLAYLEEAKLCKANLQSVDFSYSHLPSAILSEAKLQEANLSRTELRKADLTEANLKGAWLYEANLQEASLVRIKGQRANFLRAYLRGADLNQADLRGAINLTQGQIEIADGDWKTTLLPENLTPPEHWYDK